MRGLLCAAAIGIGFTGSAWAGAFRFDPRVIYPITDSAPDSVAIGDVTGDGWDDIVAVTATHSNPAGANDHKVFVYAQHPNGGLKPPVGYALSQDVGSAPGITLADLNKDQILDVAVGHYNGITLLIANGTGGFVSRPITASCSCDDLGALDIDLDGNMDIVGLSYSGDLTMFYGDGHGGIRSTATLRTYIYGDKDLKIGDVTGDSRPDLVLAAHGRPQQFFIYPHNGVDDFGPVRVQSVPADWISTVAIGDFNHDGRNDIAAATQANDPDSNIWMNYQTANGQFATPVPIASAPSIWALATADLDRDGRHDLLAIHNYYGLGHYLQRASWGPEVLSKVAYSGSLGTSQGLAVGDINHDGCADAAVAFGALTLFRGCSNRSAVGDLNLDRKSDLLWRNSSTGANVIWRSANYATQQQISGMPDTAWITAGIGDFDGDGQSDVLWRNTNTGANEIWRSASSTTPQTVAPMNQAYHVAGVGDFDGDNRSDILWRNTSNASSVIWQSADATLPRSIDTNYTALGWQVAGIGDFNADAKSDILWRSNTTGEIKALQYSALSTPINVTTVANQDWKIAGVGDFNGDDKSDLLWRNGKTGANVIWLSANSATQQSVTGVTNLAWKIAGTGDYDGDGKSDLLWRNSSTGANVIWKAAKSTAQQPVTGVTNQAWKVVP